MNLDLVFFFNRILLGLGLAMDAFSVSMANGLNETTMKKGKMCGMAGIFAFFQAMMPMIGWVCVHTIVSKFAAFEKFIPWIALILLAFIGGKMLYDGIKNKDSEETEPADAIGFEKELKDSPKEFQILSPAEKQVYDYIPDDGEVGLDFLVSASGQSVSDIMMHLLSLSVKKAILQMPGNRYRRS